MGTKSYSLVIEQTLDNPYVIYEDAYADKLVLHTASPEAIGEALLNIFTGHPRPPHLFDFTNDWCTAPPTSNPTSFAWAA